MLDKNGSPLRVGARVRVKFAMAGPAGPWGIGYVVRLCEASRGRHQPRYMRTPHALISSVPGGVTVDTPSPCWQMWRSCSEVEVVDAATEAHTPQ